MGKAPTPAQPASERGSQKRHVSRLRPYGLVPGFLVLSVVLAALPGRLALALHEAQSGVNPLSYLVVGLMVDVRDYALAFVVLSFVVAAAARLTVWRRRSFADVLRITLPFCTAALFAFIMFATVAAAEFKMERGVYATTFDVDTGIGDTGFFAAAFGLFSLARFFWTSLIAVALFALVTSRLPRALRKHEASRPWLAAGAAIVSVALLSLSCFGLHRAAPHVLRSIPHWRVVGSPLVIFASSGTRHENIQLGAISLFHKLRLPDELRRPGAAMLGYSPATVPALDALAAEGACSPHPLAVPLRLGQSGMPDEAAPAGDGSGGASDEPLSRALRRLSRALFEGRDPALRLWHVGLESFRGDDLHALNDRAPPELAPVSQRLYDRALGPRPTVIGPRNHFGSGTRTSQGVSAMLCGLGTMPLGMAFGRDLGLLPFRCLPDVLKDASFRTAFFYGSSPDFDNQRAFFNYHGIKHLVSKMDFQKELWTQDWDAPDWAADWSVFARALSDTAELPRDVPQYNLLLSLTNHFPFAMPRGAPAEIGERVQRVVASSDREISRDHVARLGTFAYTDYALGKLVGAIEGSDAAASSIIVAAADHSTPDFFLWQDWSEAPGTQQRLPTTRIPFWIVFPPALVAASQDPAATYAAIAEVNALLGEPPISQNDIPRILLELLSHYSRMSAIPEAWRWHTVGGQRMSRHFLAPEHPDALVLGVSADARVYLVDEQGGFLPVDAVARPTLEPSVVASSAPELLPGAAFLASFVQTYAGRCWQAEHIRHRP